MEIGKTGYIDASGYCLATVITISEAGPISVIVLGAGSNSRRFSEVRRLVDWVLKNRAEVFNSHSSPEIEMIPLGEQPVELLD